MTSAISNVNLQVFSLLKALTEASKASQLVMEEANKEKVSSDKSATLDKTAKDEAFETTINMLG
ncbi:hypothetical protein KKB84_07935 [bacterium]|nr:hypothetical protein [bacterium]MBU1153872.1 hypothetical protein [bacterium]MBU1782461.1 hypothetical protein [bacterium]MBU2599524.1 hypothetical protein [bacterium]